MIEDKFFKRNKELPLKNIANIYSSLTCSEYWVHVCTVHVLSNLIFRIVLRGKNYHHSTNVEAEAQRP